MPNPTRHTTSLSTLNLLGRGGFAAAGTRQDAALWLGWIACGLSLFGLAALLSWTSDAYGYDFLVREMPIIPLTAGLLIAGIVYLCAAYLTHVSVTEMPDVRILLMFVIGVGIAARLVLLPSEPALEDDYQRYMWDGAVTANGLNPYATAPRDVAGIVESAAKNTAAGEALQADHRAETLKHLMKEAGVVLPRVNHGTLRTIYPPVAQALFALAYKIKPFSLIAWRSVIFAADLVTLGLIALVLAWLGRSLLWVTLYWWNPIVLKELFNSTHMEGVLLPFVLGALVLAARKRTLLATFVTGLAAGVKLWPVILLPLIWRPLWNGGAGGLRKLMLAAVMFGVMMVIFAVPIVWGGLDQDSGFVAYAQDWKTNNALFAGLNGAMIWLTNTLNFDGIEPGMLVRMVLAIALVTVSLGVATRSWSSAEELFLRAGLLISALLLLSPAQFPWYVLWMLPFLCFRPVIGFLLLTVTFQFYYYGFHLNSRGQYDFHTSVMIWVIWVPVWISLIIEFMWHSRSALTAPQLAEIP